MCSRKKVLIYMNNTFKISVLNKIISESPCGEGRVELNEKFT